MSKHTPGPWENVSGLIRSQRRVNADDTENGFLIADCSAAITYRESEEVEANACLIAAAPDLLYALRMVAQSGPLNNGLEDDTTMAIVREALQKVKV